MRALLELVALLRPIDLKKFNNAFTVWIARLLTLVFMPSGKLSRTCDHDVVGRQLYLGQVWAEGLVHASVCI